MTKGKIITFYSYKGGVGRTMSLANIATILALWNKKVLIIDSNLINIWIANKSHFQEGSMFLASSPLQCWISEISVVSYSKGYMPYLDWR